PTLPDCGATTIFVGAGEHTHNGIDDTNPDVSVSGANLAYIIFTSGSTGEPKGILIEHRGLSNLAAFQRRVFGLTGKDRVLQFFSFSFDGSIWEIVLALTSGTTLFIASDDERASLANLLGLMKRDDITVATLPPSVLGHIQPNELPSLHTIIATAEASAPSLVARWAPGRRFFNGYGPTETTVGATLGRLNDSAPVTIGRPFDNAQVYILDQSLRPVGIGDIGEIHIGGVGLARGYLNNPGLTAERFVPHPYSAKAGERLYKTGDLARFLPDGIIEFIGRVDNQVKIRGFRVELGEIEETLCKHPAVDRSVVSARQLDGEKNLTAYLILRQQATIAPDELSAFLRLQLPEYMIPTDFVVMDSFPLTPNGKVDRAALPAPDRRRRRERREFVPPRTATEELIATLWVEALGIEQVGVYDNFFELGGHSLLAMKIIISLREKLGADVPVHHLFETPTIADIASFIDNQRRNATATSPKIPHAPAGEPIPLSYSQLMLWGVDQPGVPYNTPVAVRIAGPLNRHVLEQSITEIVRRHSILRATVVMQGGQPVHIITPPPQVTLPIRDLRSLSKEEQEARALDHIVEVADTRLDLVAGPLFNPLL
ncbi:MAG: amino acid adenylation domain-containing protein, partial [Bacteroidota bacterium]